MISRFIKIAFTGAAALYMVLICFNNTTDYQSNFLLVRMVAKLGDTFSKARNSWRAINNAVLHHLLFVLIIAWEMTITAFLIAGAWPMMPALTATPLAFKKAGKPAELGSGLGVLLWFVVFITIGSEWFLMWQSRQWNVQSTAFFLTACFLLFLIYLSQDDA